MLKKISILFISLFLSFTNPVVANAQSDIVVSIPVEEYKNLNTDFLEENDFVDKKDFDYINDYLDYVNKISDTRYFAYIYNTELNKDTVFNNINISKDKDIIFLDLFNGQISAKRGNDTKKESKNYGNYSISATSEYVVKELEKTIYLESGVSIINESIKDTFVLDTTNTLNLPENIEKIALDYSLSHENKYRFIFVDNTYNYLDNFIVNDTLDKNTAYIVINIENGDVGGNDIMDGNISAHLNFLTNEKENIDNKDYLKMLEDFYLNTNAQETYEEDIKSLNDNIEYAVNGIFSYLPKIFGIIIVFLILNVIIAAFRFRHDFDDFDKKDDIDILKLPKQPAVLPIPKPVIKENIYDDSFDMNKEIKTEPPVQEVIEEPAISIDLLRQKMMEAANLEPNKINLRAFESILNDYNKLSFSEKSKIERKYASKVETLYNKALRSKY